MQKTSQNASILIWSIFLSLIIGVFFINISTSISKTLQKNTQIKKEQATLNQINNIIHSKAYNSETLINGDEIIFSDQNYHIGSLSTGETSIFLLPATSSLNISIENGGPLLFQNVTSSSSGVVDTDFTFGNIQDEFSLQNLGGYTQFSLSASNQILPEYTDYKIIKQIGNKKVIRQSGKIKNF